ncbi:MAG: 1,3-beta-galactosyl-N-acetylhexosamine phosphorylase, partial [Oscillospiraceae bacterium]
MDREKNKGRVTIPTDVDVVPETLRLLERWGADAIRDCDGTDYPEELKSVDAKVYSTYYTTRKDNAWAKANPDEIQQCYIMTNFYTAVGDILRIPLMKGISPELMEVNTRDDITRWWEVIDRTSGEIVPSRDWKYEEGWVVLPSPQKFHEYTVSFLAYLIWDPVHMYNAVINEWKDFEHQITFDVRQPKTHAFTMKRLRKFILDHPYVNVIRYTTFFHQFTLMFDELKREKFVDWFGYSASVSPYILDQFEKEVGYPFRPEFIIDQGYYNNQYRIPTPEFKDFQGFQRREVAKIAKEMVDITHECGCEAMMFLGDHWIGTEPFMEEFKTIGLDSVVGSVGNGSTLRLISDISGVKYTEGRFLPYFFPDTFHQGGDPVREAKENWVTARRAILRKPIDRIGYGGYLKLACEFPEFLDYIEAVCKEFRLLYDNIQGTTPYCVKTVAVLNSWGKMRSWGCHMVHHALYQKQNYSYAGIIEALSGAPFDVRFISFDDIRQNPKLLSSIDVLINVGDADTAHTGGYEWCDPAIASAVRKFIYDGGGFIGVGEPTGHQNGGRFLQLASVLGVEKETGFTLNYDKYNWQEHPDHFILEDCTKPVDFGEGKKSIYALPETKILVQRNQEVQLAVNHFGKGRSVYLSGLPYSFENSRLLYRSILWSASDENNLHKWFSTNFNAEV